MVHADHFVKLEKIIKELNENNIQGDIIECGVWKGGCVAWMTHCQKQHNDKRSIYLYDTFEGMTKPSNKDPKKALKVYMKVLKKKYAREYDKWHGENKWAYCPLDAVKEVMNSVEYTGNINYIIGDVCKTLQDEKNIPDKVALLRLDTDWYESTKIELETLARKISTGGYLIIDDYHVWKGSGKATVEFMDNNKFEITYNINPHPVIFKKL